MTRHEILRTTIKMSGLALVIYGAIQALSNLPIVLESMRYAEINMPALSYITVMAGPISFGLILWLFPSSVASTVIRKDLDSSSSDQVLLGIEIIAIRAMGIFLLYHCLSNLVSNSLSYKQAISMNSSFPGFAGTEHYSIAFYVIGVEVVMAIGLILGSKGIVNLFGKIRHAS